MPCEYHEDADIGMLPGPVQKYDPPRAPVFSSLLWQGPALLDFRSIGNIAQQKELC